MSQTMRRLGDKAHMRSRACHFELKTKLIAALNNPSISEMFLKLKKNHGPLVKMVE